MHISRIHPSFILAASLALCVHTQAAPLLLDFGSTVTSAPDANGKYWNNFASLTISDVNLVDDTNTPSGIILNLTSSQFGISGGPAQGAPSGGPALPDAMPSTAYTDYYFLNSNTNNQQFGTFTFSGFDISTSYTFYIYSSRGAAGPRYTTFTATGSTVDTFTIDSALNTTVQSLTVTPNGSGIISLVVQNEFDGTAYTFSYLNAIEIAAVPEPTTVGMIAMTAGLAGLLRRGRGKTRGLSR